MARAVAKATAHTAGGAENTAYIGRQQEERSREVEPRPGEEPVAGRGEHLAEMREGDAGPARGRAAGGSDDPVWGWNVPWFVTGEAHGVWETEEGRTLLESRSLALPARHLGLGPAPASAAKLSVEEKRENLVAHFSALADFEERQRGLSHFRIILTVGPEVSTGELKSMVNDFLRANFPLCPAFVAVHDDTEHRHAHAYVHARQLDNRRVALGQDYFRLDESWMEVCAKHLDSPEIYKRHVELKEETLAWRRRAEKAREAGKPLPPKPDRWGDHHDTLLVFRPYDDRWCGRLQAQARVAETRVKWLEATKARADNVTVAREEARRLRERLDEAARKRAKGRSEAKRAMPAEVITVEEARSLLLYERDIREAEKGRGSRRKRSAPRLTTEQGALRFDEPGVERGEQLGFNFGVVANSPRKPGAAQPHAGAGREPTAQRRETTEAAHAARSFGRELVAEVRLTRTESSLSAERSAKGRRRLKEQLIKDRREYARAKEEADRHRSLLAARGADEPPYLLKDDERSYLSFMSAQVSEKLRERIMSEVTRARIISDREEEVLALRQREPEPPAVVSLPAPAKAEPSQPGADTRKEDQTADTKGEAPPPVGHEPTQPLTARKDEAARAAAAHTLPNDEVKRLTVQFELAKARACALRVAEADLNAAPHHWVPTKYKVSLAGVEEEMARAPEGEGYAARLRERRERVRDELATERIQLPMRRRNAEEEARSLETRLRYERTARSRSDLEMPDVIPSAEELRELVACAEAARDARLLKRVFEADRERTLLEMKEVGSDEPVRSLEERYAGVKLMAEVRADRSRVALARATKEPDKMPLPTTDETGRDTVATLEQAGARKGVIGVLGRLVESGERRHLREQLLQTRDAYFSHLRADVEAREAFRDAAREIVRECRELGREFGYYMPAVPDLSAELIHEARDHAVTRTGTERNDWLTACTQSQKQKDERERAAAEARRAAMTVEILLPGATGESLAELSRSELAAARERLSIESQQRTTQAITDRAQLGGHDDPGLNRAEPDMGGDFEIGGW